jgi:hypothetical protein
LSTGFDGLSLSLSLEKHGDDRLIISLFYDVVSTVFYIMSNKSGGKSHRAKRTIGNDEQGDSHGLYEASPANSTEHSSYLWKKLILAHTLKTSLSLMEAERLLPCSQEPAS